MKKLTVWALLAMFIVAGAAFAAPARVAPNASYPDITSGAPATTNNDDSCDIGVYPAATLLLPYFEVDTDGGGLGDTTIFAITNVSALPQVAHVTVWTDWSYPVLDFNIFLTGYDVQTINLYDIIERGLIAPDEGTTSDTTPGELSADNDENPVLNISNCDRLASQIPNSLLADIQNALINGKYPSGCSTTSIGTDQADGYARGYVTIDVSRACSTYLPIDDDYYTAADGIAFDNVFIGDYQHVDPSNNFAQGGPLVHIRAIPEGGTSSDLDLSAGNVETPIVNFDRTFYSRYQAGNTVDRRQPLPAVFAARWISGGSTDFATSFKIWREGVTGGIIGTAAAPSCSSYSSNSRLAITAFVLFDEEENPETFVPGEIISPAPTTVISLPETSRKYVDDDSVFPAIATGDVAGWLYMNLDANLSGLGDITSQNWVTISMEAEGRYAVEFDAAALGNGCSPHVSADDEIGPAANWTPEDRND